MAALIAVLKAARQLALLNDVEELRIPHHAPISIPRRVLEMAIRHSSETLRMDALQLVCTHPKLNLLPGGCSPRPSDDHHTLCISGDMVAYEANFCPATALKPGPAGCLVQTDPPMWVLGYGLCPLWTCS